MLVAANASVPTAHRDGHPCRSACAAMVDRGRAMLYGSRRNSSLGVAIGTCGDLSQVNRLASPTRKRPSPRSARTIVKYSSSGGSTTSQQELRPSSTVATSTSSIGVQGDAAPVAKIVVADRSSSTTPRPPPPPLATEASLDTSKEEKSEKPTPVVLVSTGVSDTDVSPSSSRGEGPSAAAETVGPATEGVIVDAGSNVAAGTLRRLSRNSEVQVERGPAVVEASDGGPPATQESDGFVISSDATVTPGAEKDPQMPEGSPCSNAHPNNSPPSTDVATAVKSATTTTTATVPTDEESNDTTQGQRVREEVGNVVDHEKPLDHNATVVEKAGENVSNVATEVGSVREDGGERDARASVPDTGVQEIREREAEDSTLVGWGQHQDASSTKTKEEEEQGGGDEELEQQCQESGDEDGGNGCSERGSPEINTTSTAVVAVEDVNVKHFGRGRHESLDGETLLGKLLDGREPSAMFEDDHEKLLQKVMRVRDDEHVSDMTSCRHDSTQKCRRGG